MLVHMLPRFDPPHHGTMRVGRSEHTMSTMGQIVTLGQGIHHSMSPLHRTLNPLSFIPCFIPHV